MNDKNYKSKLGPYIKSFISEKQVCGYSYQFESYMLKRFDKFVIESGYNDGTISRELIAKWTIQTPDESINYRNQRVSFTRQFAKYIVSLGKDAFISPGLHYTPTPDPYILTEEQLKIFLKTTDSYKTAKHIFLHQRATYSLLFRMYVCCGLRLSEPLNLLVEDIDFDDNVILVRHGKGNKDRLVYMANDLSDMCKRYDALVRESFITRTYFIVSSDPNKSIHKTTIDGVFRRIWNKTGFAKKNSKNPTVHSLRHTYVVMCLNKWMDSGLDLNSMMSYLTKQLGHSTVDGTQYYYHTSIASVNLIRKIDKSSSELIPTFNHQRIDTGSADKLFKTTPKVIRKKCKSYSNFLIPKKTNYDRH